MADATFSTIEPTASNRYSYYDYLHFIPTEQKDKYWAAQTILFNKSNSRLLVEPVTAKKFRDRNKGLIDKKDLVNIIDPKQPDGSGGEAKYFSTDWKGNPIHIHLRRIKKAKLDKLPLSHVVQAADEYFQTSRQKENARIMGRKLFIGFVNEFNSMLGLPKLRPDEDPFKYASQLAKKTTTTATNTNKPLNRSQDASVNMIDSIKAQIEDNEDLAVYNTYLHKDGAEVAVELGTEHYLTVNKFDLIREPIFQDILDFLKYTFRMYTSKTSGEPVIEYLDCTTVYTSKFKSLDGTDLTHWWIEYDITFGEWVRMFGAGLSKDELKKVFDRNRQNGGAGLGHGLEFDTCSNIQRDGARIRIGYTEWQTQNMEVWGEGNVKGNLRYDKMSSDWQPSKNSKIKVDAKRDERYYNCWYKCYYIPTIATSSPSLANNDFDLQAEFIYDFGKLQDQVRDGDDLRSSRSSLIVWNSDEVSYSEIEDRFMGKIDLLWQQFQNDLSNAMPHGLWFNEDLITDALQLMDEAQAEGKDNTVEVLRQLKQTGYGFGKMFDENGKPLPPFTEVKTNHLKSADERLTMIFKIYQLMQQCQGGNDISNGAAPKPRQALGGIEFAMQASDQSEYYIEKPYVDGFKELGYRFLYYFREIVAGKGKRLDEFRDIVSKANSAALESIDGIPLRTLGLTVDLANTEEQNKFINQFALELAKSPNGLLDPEDALQLTFINNVKYKFAILTFKMKKKRKQLEEAKQQEQQFQLQLLQEQQKTEVMKIQTTYGLKAQNDALNNKAAEQLARIENMIKYQTQSQLKTEIKDNKIEQEHAINDMKVNNEQQAPLI